MDIQKHWTRYSSCTHGIYNPTLRGVSQFHARVGEKRNWKNSVIHRKIWAAYPGFGAYPACQVFKLLNWFSTPGSCPLLLLANGEDWLCWGDQNADCPQDRCQIYTTPTYFSVLPLYSRLPYETSKFINQIEKFRNTAVNIQLSISVIFCHVPQKKGPTLQRHQLKPVCSCITCNASIFYLVDSTNNLEIPFLAFFSLKFSQVIEGKRQCNSLHHHTKYIRHSRNKSYICLEN